LELKPEVLSAIYTGCEIVHSRIAKVKIKIPWKNLSSQRLELSIEGLSLSIQEKDNRYRGNNRASFKAGKDSAEQLIKLKEATLR